VRVVTQDEYRGEAMLLRRCALACRRNDRDWRGLKTVFERSGVVLQGHLQSL